MSSSKQQSDVSKARVLEKKPLESKDAKWIKMTSIKYADPTGKERMWEAAERTTHPSTADVDAVGIVAILKGGTEGHPSSAPRDPRIVLIRQFRPPAASPVIEVPAGLMDASETPAQCAIRELREETGYHASTEPSDILVGPIMFNDPGMVATTVRMVHVTIDMTKDENKKPQRALEDGEYIEVFTVGVRELAEKCRKWPGEGVAVDARVGGLAEGIELSLELGL